jgi:hypothetical protein
MMDGRGNWINDAGENAKPSQIIDCENKSEKYLNWGWVPLVSGWGMAHGQFEKCMRDNGFIWKID